MIAKIKAFFKGRRLALAALMTAAFTAMTSLTVFGSTPTLDLQDAMRDGLSGLSGEVFGIIAIILPIALSIVGVVIAIKKGLSLVRGLVRG